MTAERCVFCLMLYLRAKTYELLGRPPRPTPSSLPKVNMTEYNPRQRRHPLSISYLVSRRPREFYLPKVKSEVRSTRGERRTLFTADGRQGDASRHCFLGHS